MAFEGPLDGSQRVVRFKGKTKRVAMPQRQQLIAPDYPHRQNRGDLASLQLRVQDRGGWACPLVATESQRFKVVVLVDACLAVHKAWPAPFFLQTSTALCSFSLKYIVFLAP